MSIADELKKVHDLLQIGAINEDEFNELKKNLLGLPQKNQDRRSILPGQTLEWSNNDSEMEAVYSHQASNDKKSKRGSKVLYFLLVLFMPYIGFFAVLVKKPFSKKMNRLALVYSVVMSAIVFNNLYNIIKLQGNSRYFNSASIENTVTNSHESPVTQEKSDFSQRVEVPVILDIMNYYDEETGAISQKDFETMHPDADGPDKWTYKDQNQEMQIVSYFLYNDEIEFEFKFIDGVLSRVTSLNVNKHIPSRQSILQLIGIKEEYSKNIYLDHSGAFRCRDCPMLDFHAIFDQDKIEILNITFDSKFPK